MYQIRDNKNNKIIARFITKTDAEKFLRIKKKEEDGRYDIIKSGQQKRKKS